MEKTPNYSPAQEALILASAVNGTFNLEAAKVLAENPAMDGENGPRTARAIVAKMTRMAGASNGELTYQRKVATTKDGSPVTKKADIVAAIAERAGVAVDKLSSLEGASKGALEIIRDAIKPRGVSLEKAA